MFYLIRHAQSEFNYAKKVVKHETIEKGETWDELLPNGPFTKLKFDPKYIDCDLTKTGIEQCLKTKQKVKDIKIEVVLVSPMRRCLQTCDIIFKDHPSKPQIIVDPDVREVFSSSCDIGGRIRQGIQEFPYFDFSKIKDHDAWYIHSIKNEEVKKKLLEKLEDGNNEDNRNEKARKILLEYIEEHALKNDRLTLSDFPAQKNNLRKLSEKYTSIAVVSHYENILAYTGTAPHNGELFVVPAQKI